MAISVICPETGTEELWELAGRANALHDFLESEASSFASRVDVSVVRAIMGWSSYTKEAEQ